MRYPGFYEQRFVKFADDDLRDVRSTYQTDRINRCFTFFSFVKMKKLLVVLFILKILKFNMDNIRVSNERAPGACSRGSYSE